jgi:pyrophosphatase PpaX
MKGSDAVLLDLDGTVLDTAELILGSWRHVRDRFGLAATDVEFRRGMGRPLAEVLGAFADGPDGTRALVDAYRTHNLDRHDALVKAFPGIPEAFEILRGRGVKLAIVTSKYRPTAERGLALTGLVVDAVVGPMDAPRPKPAPDPVWRALELVGVDRDRAVMVGDSPHDIAAARAAGVRSAAVRWGMFPEDELAAEHPDVWLDDPLDLVRLTDA